MVPVVPMEKFEIRNQKFEMKSEASPLKEVVFANSIPLSEKAKQSSKIKSLSVAPLLARAIQSIHEETSVSILFV